MGKTLHPGIKVAVQPGTKVWRIERNRAWCHYDCRRDLIRNAMKPDDRCQRREHCQLEIGSWALWTNPSADMSHGTYLKMYDDGKIENVTLDPDGSEHVFLVKEADK